MDPLKKYHDTEAQRLRTYAKNAGMDVPKKYADGGAVKGKPANTTINIVIGKDQPPQPNLAALAGAMKPKPPMPAAPPPPQAGPGGPSGAPSGMPGMPGMMGMPGGMRPPGMKAGGRATALPMTAGSGSGEGREDKADSQAKREARMEPAEAKRKA